MLSKVLKQHRSVDAAKMRPPNFYSEVHKKWAAMVENVNNGSGWKQVTSCPACQCEKATYELTKFDIELVTCSECNLRYHTRIPANNNDIYGDPVYIKGSQGVWANDYEYRKERFGRERVGILSGVIGSLKGLSILDVGCGSGYFLECAEEEGAICSGLEISSDIREWTSQRLGIEIFDRSLEELESDTRYDIITIFDLIEHVEKPVELLLNANRLLKKNGHIFIYTPNFDSFSIRVMRERSNLICPPSHVVLFDRMSMEYALDKAGFRPVFFATCGMDIADIISMIEDAGSTDDTFLVT